jgi:hypothetical protein
MSTRVRREHAERVAEALRAMGKPAEYGPVTDFTLFDGCMDPMCCYGPHPAYYRPDEWVQFRGVSGNDVHRACHRAGVTDCTRRRCRKLVTEPV